MKTIKSLRDNLDITIKRADKGGAVVIMDTQNYIDKSLEHLNQTDVYQPVDTDHTPQIKEQIDSFILQTAGNGKLKTKVAKFTQPKHPTRTPLFYHLPKIHKVGNPPRPIISGCDSPTDNISKYLTKIFNPIAQAQDSYIKDTKHLLQIIDSFPPLPENAILVTADVSSLYTNIPHEEGISTILSALDTHRHLLPTHTPNNTIIRQFLTFILKVNHFQFLDKLYLQTQGTAMGTKMAPPYANVYMSKIEKELLTDFEIFILSGKGSLMISFSSGVAHWKHSKNSSH
jgi:hypothetical protein